MKECLSPKQVAAIILAGLIGKQLQEDHPEIANLYKSGMTQQEIVEALDVDDTYGIIENSEIAIKAVCYALIGFRGNTRCEAYSGLIGENELETLCREHRSDSGERMRDQGIGLFSLSEEEQRENKQKGGRTAKSQGKGIFALTSEERRENNRRAYEKGKNWWAKLSREERVKHGEKLHEKGIGIHKLTSEEKRKAALKRLEVLGMIPWSQEEDNYLIKVLKSEDYVSLNNGTRKRDYPRIVSELNERFHEGNPTRTRIATRKRLVSLIDKVSSEELVVLGGVSWSGEEECYVIAALKSGKYVYEYKPGRETYYYQRLAEELNLGYHNGEDVRTEKAARKKVLQLKTKIKK